MSVEGSSRPRAAHGERLRRRHRFRPWRRDRGLVGRAILAVLGGLLVAVGVAGIFLPVLPGWPFLAPGLVLLAGVSRRVRYRLHRVLNRHPWIDRAYLRMRGAHRKAGAREVLVTSRSRPSGG